MGQNCQLRRGDNTDAQRGKKTVHTATVEGTNIACRGTVGKWQGKTLTRQSATQRSISVHTFMVQAVKRYRVQQQYDGDRTGAATNLGHAYSPFAPVP